MLVDRSHPIFSSLIGISWLRRKFRTGAPSLTAMVSLSCLSWAMLWQLIKDAFDGVDITLFPGILFPGEVETHLDIHADVDESIPVSIISRPVLNWLQQACINCEAIEIRDGRNQTYRPFGKIDLQWHKEGFAKQYAETFYVIESEIKLVTLGATACSDNPNESSAGIYPLELGQQTPGT